MRHDAFISHASTDLASADVICSALEAAGIGCWIAPRNVPPGSDYAATIVEAVAASRLMVVVSSSASNRSPHVSRELERAVSRGIALLPVRIEAVELSSSMEYFLASAEWLDATPELSAHLDDVVRSVQRMLGTDSNGGDTTAGVARPVDASAVHPPRRRPSRRVVTVAGALLGVAVVLLVGALVLTRNSDTATATGASHTTTTLPHSAIGGIQPHVVYDPKGSKDTSATIAASLNDTNAILSPLGPTPVVAVGQAFYLQRTPATVHYQAFNPNGVSGCGGFMSRAVTIEGLWQRDVTYGPGFADKIIVIQFSNESEAHEAFVGFSIEHGPIRPECSGMKTKFGVADYNRFDVRHEDPELPGLPAGTRQNTWLLPVTGKVLGYDFELTTIAQKGDVVVLLAEFKSAAAGTPNAADTGAVIAKVLDAI